MSSQRVVPIYVESPTQDFSLDLARETRRIVEQARSTTGATGAALGLRSEQGSIVCRASSGGTAPPAGTQFNAESGISGECVRTGRLLVCHDSENDPRVDPAVCRDLGVRSIVAVPVSDGESTVGILEVFSDRPAAFDEHHLEVLWQLARLAGAATVVHALMAEGQTHVPAPSPVLPVSAPVPPVSPASAPAVSAAAEDEVAGTPAEVPGQFWSPENLRQRFGFNDLPERFRWPVAGTLAGVVLLVLFSLVFLVRVKKTSASSGPTPALTGAQPSGALSIPKPSASENSTLKSASLSGSNQAERSRALQYVAAPPPASSSSSEDRNLDTITVTPSPEIHPQPAAVAEAVAPPDLRVTQNASNIESLLPATATLPTLTAPVSQGVTPGKLEHVVQPIYPSWARDRHVQGSVLLQVTIAADGMVKSVQVLRGDPIFARPAVEAVRQWRYKPYQLNNQPISITTDVTVNFKLD